MFSNFHEAEIIVDSIKKYFDKYSGNFMCEVSH